ncbi:MAG: hypothetical protein AB7S26_12765 [Sandaracinaceae bacterium]
MPLYRIGNEITTELPAGVDPATVRVQVRRTAKGGWQLVDAAGIYNVPGRVYIPLTEYEGSKAKERADARRAAEEKAKSQAERNAAAKQDCEAANAEYQRAFTERQRALQDWRSSYYRQHAAELGVDADFATVDNVGLFTTSAHDFVDSASTVAGLGTGGAAGFVVDAVDVLNTEARTVTQSGLLGLVDGSVVPTLGAVDRIDQAAGIGSALSRPAEIAGRVTGPLSQLGPVSNAAGLATSVTQWGQNYLERGNPFRTELPLLGNISGFSSDQLRVLANDVRTKWTPNMLEKLNGLSADELADKLDALADAKDTQAQAGKQIGEHPQSEVDAARQGAVGMCVLRR